MILHSKIRRTFSFVRIFWSKRFWYEKIDFLFSYGRFCLKFWYNLSQTFILEQTSIKMNQLVFCNYGLLKHEALNLIFEESHVRSSFVNEAVSFFVFWFSLDFLSDSSLQSSSKLSSEPSPDFSSDSSLRNCAANFTSNSTSDSSSNFFRSQSRRWIHIDLALWFPVCLSSFVFLVRRILSEIYSDLLRRFFR